MSNTLQSAGNRRFFLIDVFKVLAAQLIVLHHLAWYGPMSDAAAELSPYLALSFSWLADQGRLAVAAFLAIGGFLAAQGLAPGGLPAGKSPSCLILQRYARLTGPYAVALVLVMLSAALARRWMEHESIGAVPTLRQFIAHLFLLHDLLDFEALSAGVWYVAIDFQLYALLVMLLWGAGKLGRRPASAEFFALLLVVLGAFASLVFFNRNAHWDTTALYFFGAYALGVGAAWAVNSRRPHESLFIVAMIGLLALAVDFRPRIAVALVVSLAVGLGYLHLQSTGSRLVERFSKVSYALFLVHFPVCLLVNAAFFRFAQGDSKLNALGILLAWLMSNAAAFLFYHGVEKRINLRLSNRPACWPGLPARVRLSAAPA